MQLSRFNHVGFVTVVFAIACTVGVTVGDKVGVTDLDEHAAVEEARNLVKKRKKTKRSKEDSVQQRDDVLKATIILLEEQIDSQQEVIAVQQQDLMDLHDQCSSDPDPKEDSNTTSLMFVQIATSCELRQLEDGRVTVVGNVGNDTYVFSDRPQRLEYNMPTVDFVDMFSFNQTFQNNPPNAAITAVSNDSDQFGGPTVVILSNASMLADGSVSYDITQSQEQDNELSLASFFETGPVVQFTHCSIFIDSVYTEKTQKQGETCGGFLWNQGICDDGLSCFTGGNSNNYCVPNGKENACCDINGIDCEKGFDCYSANGCTGLTVPTCKSNTDSNKSEKFVRTGSCNVNTGEPPAAGYGFVTCAVQDMPDN